MPKDYDYKGPGVARPHPKKKWVNPDAIPVTGPSAGRPWGSAGSRGAPPPAAEPGSGYDGPGPSGAGRSPLRLIAGLIGLIVLVAIIAFLVVVFVLD